MFENRVLRGIFGCKRHKVTGEWRKINEEEIGDTYSSKKYSSDDQTKKKVLDGSCSTYLRTDLYTVLVREPELNRPLGRPRLRVEDNIKTNFQEVDWGLGLD